MPAINVARTDTFEVQRQKINEIGANLFQISQGGSDLSTGNLKLGDGTSTTPSLSFISDASLGLYKSEEGTVGFVSDSKKLNDFSSLGNVFYKDIILRKRSLDTDLSSVLNSGQGYDGGTYQDLVLSGGTGEGATASIVISSFGGSVTTPGRNYVPGSYTNVFLEGGTGSNTTVSFNVPQAEGTVTDGGSGYAPGSYYNVPLTGGSGTNMTADIDISGSTVLSGSITNSGSSYTQAVYNDVTLYNTPSTTYTVIANGSTSYSINGTDSLTLNLSKGNTYRFDISDSSNSSHILNFREVGAQESIGTQFYRVVTVGSGGVAGSFVDLIISPYAPTETIEYYCVVHPGMNGDVNVAAGSVGSYGFGATANITVNGGGNVSNVSFTDSGFSYKQNDVLTVLSSDVGGTGSGFEYTLASPIHSGEVENVSISSIGQNYLITDVLSVNAADVGGVGSGLQFTLTSTPGGITELNFLEKGSGYTAGDVLTLPTSATTQGYFGGTVTGVNATLVNSTTLTIPDTSNIIPGMEINSGEGGSAGYPQGTTVVSVDSSTTLTTSAVPSSIGATILNFSSTGSLTTVEVDDLTGIQSGFTVEVISGPGVIPSDTTVFGINEENSTVTLSNSPSVSGVVNLRFNPAFGTGSPELEYTISSLGVVEEFTISEGGNGYSIGDQLTISPSLLVQPIEYTVSNIVTERLTFTSTLSDTTFSVGDLIKRLDGAITGFAIQSSSIILAQSGASYSNVSGSSPNGSGATFNVTRAGAGGEAAQEGEVENVVLVSVGSGYQIGDTLVIPGTSIGGSSPADDLTLDIQGASVEVAVEILEVKSSGGNIDYIIAQENTFNANDNIVIDGTTSPLYTVASAGDDTTKLLLTESGSLTPVLHPDLTLYVGNTYKFNLGSGVSFSLSKFADGTNSPSLVENVSTTLDVASSQITVTSTTGIVAGMAVTAQQASTGVLIADTLVESVDSPTTLTLSKSPQTSGAAILDFSGTEYTEGVVKTSTDVTITISDATPTLYYYIDGSENAGGEEGDEAVVTIDPNNPRVFGSGFLVSVLDLVETDILSSSIQTGVISVPDLSVTGGITTNTLTASSASTSALTSPTINSQEITSSTNALTITPITTFENNININALLTVDSTSGDLETAGELKTNDSLNVNDITFITDNTLSTAPGNDFIIDTPINQVVKIAAETAFQIPAGDENAKPSTSYDGYIRFNTDTNQYEGYSEATSSWSSLGGVRDLDGNTTILAEETVGANDNTLWFINDNVNTVRFTKTHQEFVNAKKIRSVNTAAPSYTTWTANTPVDVGDYVRYKTFVFEVTAAGSTGGSASPPTDTSGNVFVNGTAVLRYATTSASSLLFEEISVLRIGEGVPLTFDNDLRITKNTISTDVSDITIQPFSEKKVVINATSSLVLPVGDNNQKGSPSRGSVRYNTTDNQFEGFDGTQWGGLGGVKDIDQDTQIKAESAPGQDEDILYFINASNESARLTTTRLEFDAIDTIVSTDSNTLNVDVSTLTFANQATTLDNSSTTSSFLFSTKDNLDFGLSVGLFNDHLLRLQDSGDIVYNLGFGTGTSNNLTLLNNNLTKFELRDVKVSTNKLTLERGTLNSANAVIYNIPTESSAKVCLTAHNTTTGDKELVEYYVVDDGTDVYFTDYNNVKSGAEIVSVVYDIDPSNNVRLTVNLDTALATGDDVIVTLVKTITKR